MLSCFIIAGEHGAWGYDFLFHPKTAFIFLKVFLFSPLSPPLPPYFFLIQALLVRLLILFAVIKVICSGFFCFAFLFDSLIIFGLRGNSTLHLKTA